MAKKGIFGRTGEIQTVLCLAFGPDGITYSGTLSGDIYKWQDHELVHNYQNAHRVYRSFNISIAIIRHITLIYLYENFDNANY